MAPQLVLASRSPARLATLKAAGLAPLVVVSGVDEDAITAPDTTTLVARLASAKAEAVAAGLDLDAELLIVGCDSLLEFEGEAHGKPADAAQARERWRRMRGRSGVLLTGHHVIAQLAGRRQSRTAVARTIVHFADLDDAEIDAYVATGEPVEVAGAFTIDSLGGAYVRSIEGDPHTVVGISLPLLRELFGELGVPWHSLWQA
ncbi:MAG: Maf family nucleotide pyrophosphatase [Propionicimonas sp.]|uniref:Maf family protein n=1 Tax=Propionicimonas sp. TaxID=1955623 RepID=UPI002B1F9F95|nr:Maf family nucleotide pyrophosphatase [Propionicimonas sp.]MEA4943497.1 Maf family nucleotide pyrophosphatase [Propionicimonas sp.]MEA5055714.1 Maf family nucleotide pyrophosphatase [Propionicimonas sp.]